MKDFVVKYPSLFLVDRSTYILYRDLNLTGLKDLKSKKSKCQSFNFDNSTYQEKLQTYPMKQVLF